MGCKCPSSYTVPAYIWAFLSILAAIICPFGLYFSNWLEIRSSPMTHWDTLSSFRLCRNESSRISVSCSSYFMFNQIYSTEWKAVTLLMGAGACFLVLVALTAIFGFFVVKLFNKVVVVLTFVFQLLGVLLFTVGIILFPVGMNAGEVKVVCGPEAGRFKLGNCQLGWAYILIIIGTVIAGVATAMSWCTIRWREKHRVNHQYSV